MPLFSKQSKKTSDELQAIPVFPAKQTGFNLLDIVRIRWNKGKSASNFMESLNLNLVTDCSKDQAIRKEAEKLSSMRRITPLTREYFSSSVMSKFGFKFGVKTPVVGKESFNMERKHEENTSRMLIRGRTENLSFGNHLEDFLNQHVHGIFESNSSLHSLIRDNRTWASGSLRALIGFVSHAYHANLCASVSSSRISLGGINVQVSSIGSGNVGGNREHVAKETSLAEGVIGVHLRICRLEIYPPPNDGEVFYEFSDANVLDSDELKDALSWAYRGTFRKLRDKLVRKTERRAFAFTERTSNQTSYSAAVNQARNEQEQGLLNDETSSTGVLTVELSDEATEGASGRLIFEVVCKELSETWKGYFTKVEAVGYWTESYKIMITATTDDLSILYSELRSKGPLEVSHGIWIVALTPAIPINVDAFLPVLYRPIAGDEGAASRVNVPGGLLRHVGGFEYVVPVDDCHDSQYIAGFCDTKWEVRESIQVVKRSNTALINELAADGYLELETESQFPQVDDSCAVMGRHLLVNTFADQVLHDGSEAGEMDTDDDITIGEGVLKTQDPSPEARIVTLE